MNVLKRLWQGEEGQDAIEYALLLVLGALAARSGVNGLATKINTLLTGFGSTLTSAST